MAAFYLGPTYEPPTGLLTSNVISAWGSQLSANLSQTLHTGQSDFGSFEANGSSVSVTVTSTQDDEHRPFFDFHYTSPFLNHTAGGTDHVTKNSVYRIGSISKLFTVYTLLVGYGWEHWDDPITRFIPELRAAASSKARNPIDDPYWDKITIGDLASQLSGIGRDYNGDLVNQDFPWMQAGLPELPPNEIPHCDDTSDTLPGCTRQEYFQGLIPRHPVFASKTTPTYSNIGFRLLGYALEAIGGTSYSALVQSKVLEPLGLSDTSAALPPNPGSWVVPTGNASRFHTDFGGEVPTAGIYSSSDNLARLGRSILLNKQLSAIDTRKWMKPTTHTSSLVFSVGSPWEIWRTRGQVANGRVVDLYTKSGSEGQYTAQLILLPDYGVSVSVLVAGTGVGVINIATEIVLQSLVPVLENITINEACGRLCGTYASLKSGVNSSVTIAADASGLYLDRWINRGVDIKAVANDYAVGTGSPPVRAVRLQATNLQDSSNTNRTTRNTNRVAYRAIFDNPVEDGVLRIMDPNAGKWGAADTPTYGEIAIDDFVIHLGANGTAMMVEPRAMRDTLQRSNSAGQDHEL
ncbi:putative penicillin-binding protein [Nemania sp. FL0916]|nr:putative penicillin-binding protein [Nemania sp. FL0916]